MASNAVRSASGSRAKCTGQRWTSVPRRWWCKPTIDDLHSSQRVSSSTTAGAGISSILRGAVRDHAYDDAGQNGGGVGRTGGWRRGDRWRSLAACTVGGGRPNDGTQIGRSGDRSSARNRRKYLAGALAEIEVGAFEALESRTPEIGLCRLLL
jgi:hypothetical protein